MTRDEILKMSAGREMDALIAEKVMGHEVNRDVTMFAGGKTSKEPYSEGFTTLGHYSTNIADAWRVVEKLDTSFSLARAWSLDDPKWRGYSFWIGNGGNAISSLAETAPLAICRAVLI